MKIKIPKLPPYSYKRCKFNKRIKCSEPIFCRCDDYYTFIYCEYNPNNVKNKTY